MRWFNNNSKKPSEELSVENWQVITRDNSPYTGKIGFYISYYGADVESVSESISDLLLKQRNCAVFYSKSDALKMDQVDKINAFRHVQCVIFPVYSEKSLLMDKSKEDLNICMAEHIPVIPVFMDDHESSDFFEKYQKIFRDLQLLMPFNSDPTKLPFENVLEHYLEGAITDDMELYDVYQREGEFLHTINEQIKSAFRGSVFLSYRKKNRRIAQELINTIRSEPALADIMIWYDEYLALGESYNAELADRINNCDFMILLGTADTLEKGNYILSHEYPKACDAKKKIILACADKKVEALCKKHFSKAEIILKENELYHLPNILKELFGGTSDKMEDCPDKKNYLLGRAYMDGKLTETDRKLGVALIERAANNSYIPAMMLMAHLYHIGMGVEVSPEKRREWLARADETTDKCAKSKKHNFKELLSLIRLNNDQGDIYLKQTDMENAFKSYEKMLKYALMIRECETDVISWGTYHIMALNKLANTCIYQADNKKARSYLQEALRIHDEIKDRPKAGGGLDYATTLSLLGNVERNETNYSEAARLYRLAIDATKITSNMARFARAYYIRCDVADSLGIIEMLQGNISSAEQCFKNLLEIAMAYMREFNDSDSKHFVCCAYRRLGDVLSQAGNMTETADCYINAVKYAESFHSLERTVSSHTLIYECCVSAGKAMYSLKKYSEAKEYLHKAERLISDSSENFVKVVVSVRATHEMYTLLGNIAYIEKRNARSYSYYKKALECSELAFSNEEDAEDLIALATAYYKILTSNLYINDSRAAERVCELYHRLYTQLKTDPVERMYHKALSIKESNESRIANLRNHVRKWTSSVLEKADSLEAYGMTCSEDISNRDRTISDTLAMVFFMMNSACEINDDLANFLGNVLGCDFTVGYLKSAFVAYSALNGNSKNAMDVTIPKSIRFLVDVDNTIQPGIDYHDGLAFNLRLSMYAIGWQVAEMIDGTEDAKLKLIRYMSAVDLYIEDNCMGE